MRLARLKLSNQSAVYHCISRIVGGQPLLGNFEKEQLRKMLWRQAAFCGLELITYCILKNHFHVLLRTPDPQDLEDHIILHRLQHFYGPTHETTQLVETALEKTGHIPEGLRQGLVSRMGDISPFMKELKQRFSRWYNATHDRYGTLWAERFKSVLVEDQPSQVGAVAAYIDLNPVRAGWVSDPKDYRFSGYCEAVAGNREAQSGIMSFHDHSSWEDVASAYRQKLYVRAGRAVQAGKTELSREEICEVLRKGGKLSLAETYRVRMRFMSDGVALGSRAFINGVFSKFREKFGPRRKDGARALRIAALEGTHTLRDLKVKPFD